MSIIYEQEARSESILDVAKKMMIAARTAPKGKGKDNLEIITVEKEEIIKISEKLKELVINENGPAFFTRDAENILLSDAMVIIGTRIKPLGVPFCGLCGFENCTEKLKYPDVPCAFNTGDLGIAVGSAVSVAMNMRVDNRIMFSAGVAAIKLNLLGKDIKIAYAIPLSCSGKNPFFDRG